MCLRSCEWMSGVGMVLLDKCGRMTVGKVLLVVSFVSIINPTEYKH